MGAVLWMAWLAIPACDDTVFPGGGGGGAPIGDETGWCAVRQVFAGSCTSCHSSSSALGGLDLESDPWAAVVGVTSAAYGVPLVTAGDPDASLLLRKLEGTQGADEGSSMPPGSSVSPDVVAVFRTWIADGADQACDGTTTVPPDEGYHPDGWLDPGFHGYGAKFGVEDCRTCHGATLEGGTAGEPACSSCHPPNWETTCTFCHGDPDRGSELSNPAPPQNIDDGSSVEVFPAHLKHLDDSALHGPWDCTECHVKPTSALDAGHLFDDDTKGRADITFAGGLSPQGDYRAATFTCTNLYCHGATIGSDGTISVGESAACGTCHAGPDSDGDDLSGQHDKHLEEGIECAECHSLTVNGDGQILSATKDRHVDGEVTVDFLGPGMQISNLRCTGSCHGENHNNRYWLGDD